MIVPFGICDSTSVAPNNIFPAVIVTIEMMKNSTLRIVFLECARPKLSRPMTIRSPPTMPTRSAIAMRSPRRKFRIDAAISVAIAV